MEEYSLRLKAATSFVSRPLLLKNHYHHQLAPQSTGSLYQGSCCWCTRPPGPWCSGWCCHRTSSGDSPNLRILSTIWIKDQDQIWGQKLVIVFKYCLQYLWHWSKDTDLRQGKLLIFSISLKSLSEKLPTNWRLMLLKNHISFDDVSKLIRAP